MIHKAKPTEIVWIYSMGKRFQMVALATTDEEANRYCETHSDAAVIACFGPFVIIANKYAGVRDTQEEMNQQILEAKCEGLSWGSGPIEYFPPKDGKK